MDFKQQQLSNIDIPQQLSNKGAHITATTYDGHAMDMTDSDGNRRNSLNTVESGISPTYYTPNGSIVHTCRQTNDTQTVGSPVYGDKSRIFFSHNSACSCRGSGVGCECSKTCSC